MQGRSWVPLLRGENDDWRQSFLAEYFYEQNFLGTPTLVAVRTADAKLIQYPGHEEWTELFDLAKDPYETNNLANDATQKELLKQMKAEFDREVQATEFRIPDYADQPGATNKAPASQKLKRRSDPLQAETDRPVARGRPRFKKRCVETNHVHQNLQIRVDRSNSWLKRSPSPIVTARTPFPLPPSTACTAGKTAPEALTPRS